MARSRIPCPSCDDYMNWDAKACKKCRDASKHHQAVRPRHYPPECPTCRGFGYTQTSSIGTNTAWSRCGACKAHPGHSCSHSDWTALRA